MDAMRLFLALMLPDDVRHHLCGVSRSLERSGIAAGVRWTAEKNLHVTLKFLGEVDEPTEQRLIAGLNPLPTPPMTLHAAGLEFFPPRGPARIVAARIEGDLEPLQTMQSAIEDACAAEGFTPENRRFLPHVTIGRAKSPLRGLAARLAPHLAEGFPGPTFRASGFTLVQSLLDRDGAKYLPRAHWGEFAA